MKRLLIHAIAKGLNAGGQLRLTIRNGWTPRIWEHDGRTQGGAIFV